MTGKALPTAYHETRLGRIYHADSLDVMKRRKKTSVDLIMTSPPFALTRKDATKVAKAIKKNEDGYYRIPHPGLLWNGSKRRPKPMRRDESSTKAGSCYPGGAEKLGKERRPGALDEQDVSVKD